MAKPDKTAKSRSPFERFEHFVKALVSVPRKELQDKLRQYERQKKSKKATRIKRGSLDVS